MVVVSILVLLVEIIDWLLLVVYAKQLALQKLAVTTIYRYRRLGLRNSRFSFFFG